MHCALPASVAATAACTALVWPTHRSKARASLKTRSVDPPWPLPATHAAIARVARWRCASCSLTVACACEMRHDTPRHRPRARVSCRRLKPFHAFSVARVSPTMRPLSMEARHRAASSPAATTASRPKCSVPGMRKKNRENHIMLPNAEEVTIDLIKAMLSVISQCRSFVAHSFDAHKENHGEQCLIHLFPSLHAP